MFLFENSVKIKKRFYEQYYLIALAYNHFDRGDFYDKYI